MKKWSKCLCCGERVLRGRRYCDDCQRDIDSHVSRDISSPATRKRLDALGRAGREFMHREERR